MPKASHAVARASAQRPTFAQLKDFFAQLESGRISKTKLQGFLRGLQEVPPAAEQPRLSIHLWMALKGFAPADGDGYAQPVLDSDPPYPHMKIGFLRCGPDTNPFRIFNRYRRPFVATLVRDPKWVFCVHALKNVPEFQELAKELEELYGVQVEVR
ncbi:MAG: hypothetical protein V4436_01970, partial [Patescibacteria group bacterium]